MNAAQRSKSVAELFEQVRSTLDQKGQAYSDPSDAWGNFRRYEMAGVSVPKGILTRIVDKVSRMGNLLNKGGITHDESVADTAVDLVGYAALLAVYLREQRKRSSLLKECSISVDPNHNRREITVRCHGDSAFPVTSEQIQGLADDIAKMTRVMP